MRRTTTAALGLATAALLAACGQADPGQPAPPTHDPGLAHVHGLGVDPADGTLYAASHHGLFRVPENGKPERVGTLRQDTMGFTVVGPHHFLGSGHPDPTDEDAPRHLGLVESTDAGRTWTSLSLAGQADFHALEAKHGSVYGYDSQTGRLAVTADRRNWDRRAQVEAVDFAVSPTTPDVLLATTAQGVARSTDGGRTFTAVAGAPVLQLLDWPADATIVGVAPDGTVRTSADGGTTWTRHGTVPGRPAALATNGPAEVFLATDDAIHRSKDGGRTFTTQALA
ncbi:F510_1955 family glycosylhydrolase [Saccharothrix sp.]|uniref:F510_1955 family glycosylhydrolase n=1 Tax=Saccharothrix sp. TaxID=1873460 RepID=UPI002811154C|nr:exo-alpha-sialidase [Saccharothrix sp.]